MSDDVRIATGFKHHRKTKRLRRRLGSEGVEWLIYLWAWAADARWTGDLTGLTDQDIEDDIDWPGDAGVLIATLAELKFIDGPPGARRLHDWEHWNPYAASKGNRIARGKKGSDARWGKAKNEGQGDLPFPGDGGDEPPKNPTTVQGGIQRKHASSMESDASSTETMLGGMLKQCPPAPAPAPTPSKSESSARAGVSEAAERTAQALQAAGCGDVHDQDPRLHTAIAEGLGAALIAMAGTKKGRGKGLAYLLTTVRGQKADAEKNSDEKNSGVTIASSRDLHAEARREYENALIEARHFFGTTRTIDAAERDRRVRMAEERYRKAVGEAAQAPRETNHRSENAAVNA